MRLLAVLALLIPLHAHADPVIDRVIDTVALPGVTRFAQATDALNTAAKADCTAQSPALRDAWNRAMDAWMGIQNLRLGPLEDAARRQVIAYWPDSSGHRPRALSRLLRGTDPVPQGAAYRDQPVSARGLYAIETIIYDPKFNQYTKTGKACDLVRAVSDDLAQTAADLAAQWPAFATLLRTAGAAGNPRFLDPAEARQALFTALLTSLQFDINERLGQPLGTHDKPRPQRAESRLSRRAQRNLDLSIAAHEALALALVPDATAVAEDFDRLRWMTASLADPDFSGVASPTARFRIEALQTALTLLRNVVNEDLSRSLGVSMGLNALDGD